MPGYPSPGSGGGGSAGVSPNPGGSGTPLNPGGSGSSGLRSGDYRVQTEELRSLSSEWRMLSNDVQETGDIQKDPELGIAKSQTGNYNTFQNQNARWTDGASSETMRIGDSLDSIAQGYEWQDVEAAAASRAALGGPTNVRAV